jgi:hypothetical protein
MIKNKKLRNKKPSSEPTAASKNVAVVEKIEEPKPEVPFNSEPAQNEPPIPEPARPVVINKKRQDSEKFELVKYVSNSLAFGSLLGLAGVKKALNTLVYNGA